MNTAYGLPSRYTPDSSSPIHCPFQSSACSSPMDHRAAVLHPLAAFAWSQICTFQNAAAPLIRPLPA